MAVDKAKLAQKGRYEDNQIAHVADGEIIVPNDVSPYVRDMLLKAMADEGFDPSRYTVGGENNSINPETGEPEYFGGIGRFFKKKIAKPVSKLINKIPGGSIIAPVAVGALTGGLGIPAASALGAGAGYLISGGNLKNAIAGGITGGLGAGGAGALGSGLNSTAKLGLTGVQSVGLGAGLGGAVAGGLVGGGKGALLGGIGGGLGAYANAGGFDGVGDNLFGKGATAEGALPSRTLTASSSTPLSSAALVTPGGGSAYGSDFDAALGSSFEEPSLLDDAWSGLRTSGVGRTVASAGRALTGSDGRIFSRPGIADGLGAAAALGDFATTPEVSKGVLSGLSGDSVPEGFSPIQGFSSTNSPTEASLFSGKNISPLLSAGIGTYTQQGAADDIIEQQEKNRRLISPFLNDTFDPGDLENEPGYQFQLKQGMDALGRTQAARGNFFSGGALRAAQDYGQGLAGQSYKDAYGRWLSTRQQQLGAAGAIADANNNIGMANAKALIGTGNALTQGVASLFPSERENAYTLLLQRLAAGGQYGA